MANRGLRRRCSRPAPGEVWAAATYADATLARTYLSQRGCWLGRHVPGAPALPESVRWLACAGVPDCASATSWPGPPAGVAGAVVFAGWPTRRASNAAPVAVTLIALDARGFPVREARCTVGTCAGAVFRTGDRGDKTALTVEADAAGQVHANCWPETPLARSPAGRYNVNAREHPPHAQRRIKGRSGPCTDCRGEGERWINGRVEPREACDGTGEVPREDREGTT